MKFIHVYNDWHIKGLEKNGLINKDSGFKIQHGFSVPVELKFNEFAAKGTNLHNLIKSEKMPFYVDRITGGTTYHHYDFDQELIDEYKNILGDWFLGFQLHESGSNRRLSDWKRILRVMEGHKGPYDVNVLREKTWRKSATLQDGTVLSAFSQGTPERYAQMRYAETPKEYLQEMEEMFQWNMSKVKNLMLPCDSYYMATKIQSDLGIKTFMPEVGWQIPQMRQAVAVARGHGNVAGKSWGTYYETWIENKGLGYSMPCFNSHPLNEWYLTQEQHGDDFTTYGHNGGSSRLLQNRVYYYSLMSGADYLAEEWGLNCSYSDMETFELSEYGLVKKDFINTALTLRGIKAVVPFAIVLPKKYSCIVLPQVWDTYEFGVHCDNYLDCLLDDADKAYYGHIEDTLKFVYARNGEIYGNEGHTLTNTRFGDLFDIIYEDAPAEVLAKYEYLIDASPNSDFAKAKSGTGLKILETTDFGALEVKINELAKKILPCTVDGLHWLLSTDENGKRYVSIFNNEGNMRTLYKGNEIDNAADRTVTVTFAAPAEPKLVKGSEETFSIQKCDNCTYKVTVPATGFAIFEY